MGEVRQPTLVRLFAFGFSHRRENSSWPQPLQYFFRLAASSKQLFTHRRKVGSRDLSASQRAMNPHLDPSWFGRGQGLPRLRSYCMEKLNRWWGGGGQLFGQWFRPGENAPLVGPWPSQDPVAVGGGRGLTEPSGTSCVSSFTARSRPNFGSTMHRAVSIIDRNTVSSFSPRLSSPRIIFYHRRSDPPGGGGSLYDKP